MLPYRNVKAMIFPLAERLGSRTIEKGRAICAVVAVAATAVWLALQPRRWSQPVRDVLGRQILFTGVDAMGVISGIAVLVGLSVILQIYVALTRLGQSTMIGPLLVAILIREAGPLLVNFIVIARSGTAIASELSAMQVTGEVRVLDALGLDPLLVLVMPRAIGVAISVVCLTVLFLVLSFASGYVGGLLLGVVSGSPGRFLGSVFNALRPADLVNVITKALVPGLLTGTLCSVEGLGVRGALSEVPQAATRGVVKSFISLFLVSAIVSVLTYL